MRERSCIAATAIGATGQAFALTETSEWDCFKARFLTAEGRIRDTGNQDISHSEGQAWGLLLAAQAGDETAFTSILRWTHANLGIRPDHLLAWRYRPGARGGVDDLNNATDGDLYHAYALLVAHRRWPDRGHLNMARLISDDIIRLNVRRVGPRLVLLPGAVGFESAGHVEVNPSYYAFKVLDALAEAFPGRCWAELASQGDALLREARFGAFGLPPDWLRISRLDGALTPVAGRGERFGYDAIRVPLNLAWAGRGGHPVIHATARFWSNPAFPHVPAWIRLSTAEISPYAAGAGALAIAWLVLAQRSGWGNVSALPRCTASTSYYDAVLTLLVRQAWSDLARAVPAA